MLFNSADKRTGYRCLCTSLIVAAAAFVGYSSVARAQSTSLPQGNITLIVPLAAGGPADSLARILTSELGPRLSRTIVVENRPGAAGNIGAAAVAKATPDGATWLYTVDSVFTVNPLIYKSQGFDPDQDLAPIAQVGRIALMLAVNSKVPASSWAELLELGKKSDLNFGSAGIGSPGHLAFEYLKSAANLRAAHVPFRGAAPVMNELVAGNIQAAFVVSGVLVDHVQSGALRALAVSSARRVPSFPNVPTAVELGIKDFEATFTNLLMVSSKSPEAVRLSVAKEVAGLLKTPQVMKRFEALSTEPSFGNADSARALIKRERARWAPVVKASGMDQATKK